MQSSLISLSRRQFGFGLGSIAFAGLAARAIAQAPPLEPMKYMAMGRWCATPTT